MLPLWAIGALAGAAKSEFIDKPRQQQQIASRAIEARFNPLMGKAAPSFADIKQPNTAQSAMDWGMVGLKMGQNKERYDEAKAERAQFLADRKATRAENAAFRNKLLASFAQRQEAPQASDVMQMSEAMPLGSNPNYPSVFSNLPMQSQPMNAFQSPEEQLNAIFGNRGSY